MKTPLISFVIPTFQQEDYVEQAVRSALGQTNANIEVIVADDGSTDATYPRVTAIRDSRLKAHQQENAGPSAALNTAIAQAQGDWIAIIGGDDIAEPDRASHQLMLADRLETDAVYSVPSLIDDAGEEIEDDILALFKQEPAGWEPHEILRKLAMHGNFFCAPTAFLKRTAFEKVGPFNEALIQLQDYEHLLRWVANNFSIRVSAQPVTRYRRLKGSLSSRNRDTAVARELDFVWGRMLRHGSPAVWRQAFKDAIDPHPDLETPLSLLDQVAIHSIHPHEAMHREGARRLIDAMQGPDKPLSVRDYMSVLNARFY